jgi:hypothetical protein
MMSDSPSAWRGAAFECRRTHRMIVRKTLALSNVVQQAAPGNVYTRGLPSGVLSFGSNKKLQVLAASGDVRGSRPPTHAESGKPNVPIILVRLGTVKSGSPPGAGELTPWGSCVFSGETGVLPLLPTFALSLRPRSPCALPLRAALGNDRTLHYVLRGPR